MWSVGVGIGTLRVNVFWPRERKKLDILCESSFGVVIDNFRVNVCLFV